MHSSENLYLTLVCMIRVVVPPGVPILVPNDAQTGTSSRPRGSMPLKRSQGHADTFASEHDPAPVPRVGLEPTTR